MEIISTLLISAAVVAIISLIRYVWKRRAFGRIMAEFAGVAPYYDEIISRYFMYYNRLSSEAKQKFLFRTFLFKKSKKFHYVEISESPEMPVLISAVAVQLTLGLDKYLLNYFRNIYVLREDYHYGHYSMPFMGHVDRSGIYLSWDNFLKGVEKASSPSNLGLHEMAHALTYVNFVTESDEDKHFKREFHRFSKIARPIFNEMQAGRQTLLGEYAASNYNEFWAVAVEVFFECPARMKYELPDLYGALSRLLKQDPLRQDPLRCAMG